MKAKYFFLNPKSIRQKQYEALLAYYGDNKPAKEVPKNLDINIVVLPLLFWISIKSLMIIMEKTFFY